MARAYCIVNIVKIYDRKKFEQYLTGHTPTLEPYGGRLLVRDDRGEVLEGTWPANQMSIYEFAGVEQLKAWYQSEEYRLWKELRQSCADVNVMVVRGS